LENAKHYERYEKNENDSAWKLAAAGGLNPTSNFRYLLSTQQQQVVDSTEVPLLPSFHKFSTVYFALQNKCAPVYRSANKGSQGEKIKKTENLARTFRLLRRNIPDGLDKAGSILDEGNFQIPSGGLANETVRTKRYSAITFEREYLAENQELIALVGCEIWSKISSFQTAIHISIKYIISFFRPLDQICRY